MLSTARVNAALTKTMNDTFLEKARMVGKEDNRWLERGENWLSEKKAVRKYKTTRRYRTGYYTIKTDCIFQRTMCYKQK